MIEIDNRKSSIELLRIIAMFFIITSHYSVHGGFKFDAMHFSFNKLLLNYTILGNLGANIFFIISGFFLSKSKFCLEKIFKLIFQTMTYSIIIYVILCIIDNSLISKNNIISAFIPITLYWFITAYTIIYLLFPYFNKLINAMNKKEFIFLLLIMLVFWSILPTSFKISLFPSVIIDVIILYFIGAYIRYYIDIEKINSKLLYALLTIFVLIMLVLTLLTNMLNYPLQNILIYYNKNSIFTIIISVLIFVIFCKFKFTSKFINYISSCVFGVYLFHDNEFIRYRIWQTICKNYLYQDSKYLILHLMTCVLMVFIIGIIIELIRKRTIGKITDKIAKKSEKRIKEIIYVSEKYYLKAVSNKKYHNS